MSITIKPRWEILVESLEQARQALEEGKTNHNLAEECRRAAEMIREQMERNVALKAALRPFAEHGREYTERDKGWQSDCPTFGKSDFMIARAVYEAEEA